MADANQAWELDEALIMFDALAEFDLDWLEEPIAADRPKQEWENLKQTAPMPIAAGENIQGEQEFAIVINENILSVIQPDLAKWGGLSKTIQIARSIIASGKRYCPHYLGGGIGLIASAHALAAVGGDGILEVDINPNPLRTELVGDMLTATPGVASLGPMPGLGYEPDLAPLKDYRVL